MSLWPEYPPPAKGWGQPARRLSAPPLGTRARETSNARSPGRKIFSILKPIFIGKNLEALRRSILRPESYRTCARYPESADDTNGAGRHHRILKQHCCRHAGAFPRLFPYLFKRKLLLIHREFALENLWQAYPMSSTWLMPKATKRECFYPSNDMSS
jgi:hypothetical protein